MTNAAKNAAKASGCPRIAILGTRGIPANYSGFETSVQETAIRFVKSGLPTTVYCRSSMYPKRLDQYHGVKLVYFPSLRHKHLDTVTHSFLSLVHVLCAGHFDIIQIYGVGNALVIPFLRLFRFPVVAVLDGADWERVKWGRFAKLFLRMSRTVAVQFASAYVIDNAILAQEYRKRYKKAPVEIAYGAKKAGSCDPSILQKYGVIPGSYLIFIGRFVKEKGIEFLLKNYAKIQTDVKLVVVGGNDLDKQYEQFLRNLAGPNVIFPGFVYGNDYESLLKHAQFYISCSTLEGTSPSLLSAMAVNGFALVSDLPENIEVLRGTCATFKTADDVDFIARLSNLLSISANLDKERERTFQVVKEHYDWDTISEKYKLLFAKLMT